MTLLLAAIALALGCARQAAAAPAVTQMDSATTAFLARARVSTAKYRNRSRAIADGYRAMGPESPAMGQHWVQPTLLVATRFDPDRPPILEYATVREQPLLVGVAYALPLTPTELPPEFPAGRAAWHSHWSDIAVEALRLSHEDVHTAEPGDRVAVLHVWVWVDNPAGPFSPLNWVLPYLRAGLEAPASPERSAKALSLRDAGAAFWEAALGRALDLDPRGNAAVHRVLTAYGDTVRTWQEGRSASPRLTPDDTRWLEALWGRLQASMSAALGTSARAKLIKLTGF